MSDAERPDGPGREGQQPQGPQPQGPQPQGPQQQGPYGPAGPYGGQQPGPYGQQPQPGRQPGQQPPASYGPVPGGPYGPQPGQPGANPYGPPGQPGQNPYGPSGQPGANPYGPPGQPGQNPYGPPGQPGPYGAMPPGGGGKKSKLPLILIAAGVVLLLLIGGVVALVRSATDSADDPASTGSGSGASSAPAADKPSDAVLGYLQALADQDPDKAIGYLEDEPADKTFLSREVLAASAKTAAISAVDVPEVTDKYAFKVTSHYKLGDKPVTEDYDVSEVGGSWKVGRAVTEIDLSYQRDDTLAMKINGVAVKEDKVSLFPGHYVFTTDNDYISFGSKNSLTLTGPSDYDSPQLTPTLTSAGKTAFVKSAKAAFEKCLGKHDLSPSGCPNRINEDKDQKFKQSTVRWSVTNNPFKNVRADLDSTDPTSVEARFSTSYNFKADATLNGQRVKYDGPPTGLYGFRATGDLSKKDVPVKLASSY